MTGRVAKLGARVSTDSLGRPLAEGDRVAHAYFYPCGRCPACLRKEPAACLFKVGRLRRRSAKREWVTRTPSARPRRVTGRLPCASS